MIAKGQDPSNIRLGDTLADDQFADRKFDYCLANPPYGFDWKASEKAVKAERQATGARGRFAAGLPKIGDGQMLFLANMVSKMNSKSALGSRIAEVHNGSSLFTGDAGQGESNIRRWVIESVPQAHGKEVREEPPNRVEAAWKMRAGPSESAFRSGLQTTPSGCGQEPWS